MSPTLTPTCQICGRAIRAKTGLVAHHGYRRPQPYLQTRSCFGARRRPYEVAYDAIDEYLGLLKIWLEDAAASVETFWYVPPGYLTYRHQRDAWDPGKTIRVDRPANFNPGSPHDTYIPRTYAYLYRIELRDRERAVLDLTAWQKEITTRRAAWVAPT